MEVSRLNRILGANVRRLRVQQNLSQEGFADKCGLHRTYIGSVERGERNVTLVTVERLAAALNVQPIDLMKEVRE